MTTLNLAAKQDHLEKVAKSRDPVKAISEFVWNALDADATRIDVMFETNPLGGIQAIVIRDNGSGITPSQAQRDFSSLGDSWKRQSRRTPLLSRVLHGKEGRGRLRFFSLAESAAWKTIYREGDQYWGMSIKIESQTLDKCDVSEPNLSDENQTGTVVELTPLKETFDWLVSRQSQLEFCTLFAAYLLRYPDVRINYNGTVVDPASTISRTHDFPKEVLIGPKRTIKDLSLKVIEWSSQVEGRKIHLGGESGIVLGSQPAYVVAPGFDFSAYANSTFFQEMADANLLELDDLSDPDFMYVMERIRELLGDYFRSRQAERSKGLIDDLKNAGVYPYEGDPRDELERRERQVFDIATYAVSSYSREFKKADTSLKRMTLALLREAVRHNPDALSTILRAVVNLPKARQDEFSSLLEKTELGNIISASSLIADRITALELLKGMVFNPKFRSTVKERGELDAVVRDNTWIFGERFHITLAEVGLTRIMDRVSEDLQEKTQKRKVRKMNGGVGRADCFLGRSVPQPDQAIREYIVVELKRPSLQIGRAELDQLEDYVISLKSQPDFINTKTIWNFYLITGDFDESISERVRQKGRAAGLFLENENSQVWVKTWAELIRDCESRLHFIQEKLQIDVSDAEIEARISALKSSLLREEADKTGVDLNRTAASG